MLQLKCHSLDPFASLKNLSLGKSITSLKICQDHFLISSAFSSVLCLQDILLPLNTNVTKLRTSTKCYIALPHRLIDAPFSFESAFGTYLE